MSPLISRSGLKFKSAVPARVPAFAISSEFLASPSQ
jgi:hypothetical protein